MRLPVCACVRVCVCVCVCVWRERGRCFSHSAAEASVCLQASSFRCSLVYTLSAADASLLLHAQQCPSLKSSVGVRGAAEKERERQRGRVGGLHSDTYSLLSRSPSRSFLSRVLSSVRPHAPAPSTCSPTAGHRSPSREEETGRRGPAKALLQGTFLERTCRGKAAPLRVRGAREQRQGRRRRGKAAAREGGGAGAVGGKTARRSDRNVQCGENSVGATL